MNKKCKEITKISKYRILDYNLILIDNKLNGLRKIHNYSNNKIIPITHQIKKHRINNSIDFNL